MNNRPNISETPPPLPQIVVEENFTYPTQLLAQKLLPSHFRRNFLIIAFLSVGPLALPLVWFHPTMRLVWKLVITFITVIVSYALYLLMVFLFGILMEQYNILRSLI